MVLVGFLSCTLYTCKHFTAVIFIVFLKVYVFFSLYHLLFGPKIGLCRRFGVSAVYHFLLLPYGI